MRIFRYAPYGFRFPHSLRSRSPKKRSAAALTSGARRLPVGASETDTKELQNMNNLTIIGFVGGNAECHLTHNFAELEP